MENRDIYNSLDIVEKQPITLSELKARLKQLVSLTIGLMCDISNELNIRDTLIAENERLKLDLKHELAKTKPYALNDEQKERHRQSVRRYQERKRHERE